jgi:hypothetical protein
MGRMFHEMLLQTDGEFHMFWELHGTFPILAVAGLNLSSWWQCHYLMRGMHFRVMIDV